MKVLEIMNMLALKDCVTNLLMKNFLKYTVIIMIGFMRDQHLLQDIGSKPVAWEFDEVKNQIEKEKKYNLVRSKYETKSERS